jgi:hypothetical protein
MCSGVRKGIIEAICLLADEAFVSSSITESSPVPFFAIAADVDIGLISLSRNAGSLASSSSPSVDLTASTASSYSGHIQRAVSLCE